MKNIKIIVWILVAIIIISGFWIYLSRSNNKYVSTVTTPATTTNPANSPAAYNSSVTYNNTDYGFNFSLPADWKGYSVVTSSWTGYPEGDMATTNIKYSGVKLLLRNPNWTAKEHYEDIPIMIFTIADWNSYIAGDFSVSAAPFPAGELARNNKYVFAIPPRWDYDYSQGYQEAENILNTKPLQPFNL